MVVAGSMHHGASSLVSETCMLRVCQRLQPTHYQCQGPESLMDLGPVFWQ